MTPPKLLESQEEKIKYQLDVCLNKLRLDCFITRKQYQWVGQRISMYSGIFGLAVVGGGATALLLHNKKTDQVCAFGTMVFGTAALVVGRLKGRNHIQVAQKYKGLQQRTELLQKVQRNQLLLSEYTQESQTLFTEKHKLDTDYPRSTLTRLMFPRALEEAIRNRKHEFESK